MPDYAAAIQNAVPPASPWVLNRRDTPHHTKEIGHCYAAVDFFRPNMVLVRDLSRGFFFSAFDSLRPAAQPRSSSALSMYFSL